MSKRRIESFVLRIVIRDEMEIVEDDWCGRIQHIATGDERQFSQLRDLLAFMATYVRETDPPNELEKLAGPQGA